MAGMIAFTLLFTSEQIAAVAERMHGRAPYRKYTPELLRTAEECFVEQVECYTQLLAQCFTNDNQPDTGSGNWNALSLATRMFTVETGMGVSNDVLQAALARMKILLRTIRRSSMIGQTRAQRLSTRTLLAGPR
jgi:hypothetical protein